MKRTFTVLCLFVSIQTTFSQTVKQIIQESIQAFGGEDKLRQSQYFESERIGYENFLEQSERFEGPYIKTYHTNQEKINLADHKAEIKNTSTSYSSFTSTFLVDNDISAIKRGERIGPFLSAYPQDLDFHPLNILFTALAATDFKLIGDKEIQGVSNYAISFKHKGKLNELYINKFSKLPTGYKQTAYKPNTYMAIWGDAATITMFSFWNIEPNGVRFPHQIDMEMNGLPFSSFYTTKIDFKPKDSVIITPIPENVTKKYQERISKTELSPIVINENNLLKFTEDIIQIPGIPGNHVPGTYNVTLINQGDGIVILEAPVSSWYSKSIINYVHKIFPGKHIKALITTSDSWPHIGGLREYSAQNIPVYHLKRNTSIINTLLTANYRTNPDSLALLGKKSKVKLIPISEKYTLKGIKNSLEIYPFNTETGERMMMVYLPEAKLLYASDLIQRNPDGTFFIGQYSSEVVEAVSREKLDVKQVFAMHSGLNNWIEITDAVKKMLNIKG